MTISEAFTGMNKASREPGGLQPEGAEIAKDYESSAQSKYNMDNALNLIAFLLHRVNVLEAIGRTSGAL